MTWPTFLAPQWAWLGLLAVPIILLYVLRQKRPDTPVSSTLLWSKALSDMRASTPWQKLRRNLQLLLQLLILAAIVLTLMRPVVQAKATQAIASVIVIDATASMQTLDADKVGGNISRFDRAREQARQLIAGMRPADRLNIIVDGGGMTQSSSGFLSSKSELNAFVNGLRPSDGTSDLSESLLLAATSLRSINAGSAEKTSALTAGRIYLLSDGAGVVLPQVYKSQMLNFIQMGNGGENVGITRLAVTSLKQPRTHEVFVEVLNASPHPQEVSVGLALGTADRFVDARKETVPARSKRGITFEKVVADPGPFYVVLSAKADDLAVDNTVFGIFSPPQKIRVALIGGGNSHLDRIIEDFLRTPGHVGELAIDVMPLSACRPDLPADLAIFAGVTPPEDKLPKCDLLFFRPEASIAGFTVKGGLTAPPALRWMRDAPELIAVEVGEMRVSRAVMIERDPTATELISTTTGPLLAYRDVGAARRYAMAFSPTAPDSNWWQFSSFLILMENIVSQTRSRHYIGTPQIVSAGMPARLAEVDAGSTVETPSGNRAVGRYVKDGVTDFPETDKAGIYTVRSSEKTRFFAVNVLSETESDLAPKQLTKGDGGNVEQARSVAAINREIWQWVAAAGLLLLLVEWIVYHRRLT